jgi:hypothetical protein
MEPPVDTLHKVLHFKLRRNPKNATTDCLCKMAKEDTGARYASGSMKALRKHGPDAVKSC